VQSCSCAPPAVKGFSPAAAALVSGILHTRIKLSAAQKYPISDMAVRTHCASLACIAYTHGVRASIDESMSRCILVFGKVMQQRIHRCMVPYTG
jgi:hypothetical protein